MVSGPTSEAQVRVDSTQFDPKMAKGLGALA
jgi:hypothetical protein